MANFKTKIQSCKELLSKLPGLETSTAEQEKEFEELKEQLNRKQYVCFWFILILIDSKSISSFGRACQNFNLIPSVIS